MSAAPFVVRLGVEARGGPASGTGFLVSADGHVVTCEHVVAGAHAVRAYLTDGRACACDVLGEDGALDLALLRLRCDAGAPLPPPAALCLAFEQGDDVSLFGCAAPELYAEPEQHRGNVSAYSAQYDGVGLSLSIAQGDSGGPVVNSAGAVVAVARCKDRTRDGRGMAVPARRLAELLRRHGVEPVEAPPPAPAPQAVIGVPIPLARQGTPQFGPFFGRDDEARELRDALVDTAHPVAVLVGMAGMGKTALTLQVAASLEGDPFAAVVWTTARDGPLHLRDILDAIARVWHFPFLVQLDGAAKEREVRRTLAERRTLLVIDNYETIADPAVHRFVREVPPPTAVLLSTRVRVRIPRADLVELEGLDEHTARALLDDALERAHVSPRLVSAEHFARLYARTGGAPLAVEWAASSMTVTSARHVLKELEAGRAEPMETMFGVLWAEALGDAERAVLCAASVLPTPASEGTLAAMTALDEDAFGDAARRLRELVLLHVVAARRDETAQRFTLHPLTRAFAAGRLAETPGGAAEMRERLAREMLRLAAEYGGGPEAERWERFDHLDDDRETLLAVARWCAEERRLDLLLPLLRGIGRYLFVYGHWQDRVEVCWRAVELLCGAREPAALPAAGDVADDDARRALAWLLRDVGRVYTNQGRHDESAAVLARALEYAERAGDRAEVGFVHFHLGELAFRRGDLDAAERHWRTALEHERAVGRVVHVIGVEYWMGVLAYRRGALDAAERQLTANLAECERVQWPRLAAYHLHWLGDIALARDDGERACGLYGRAFEIVKDRDTRRRALLELSLGRLERAAGRGEAALRWLDEAARHFTFLGMEAERREAEELAAAVRGAVPTSSS